MKNGYCPAQEGHLEHACDPGLLRSLPANGVWRRCKDPESLPLRLRGQSSDRLAKGESLFAVESKALRDHRGP
jgi:hypothetical protein